MAELTSEGYQTLRDYFCSATTVPNEWDHLALYDDNGTEVTRVSITGDTRAQWTDVDGDAVLTAEITVTGGDNDISTPVTLQSSAIWNASSGGAQCTPKETFPDATLNQSSDEVNVTHTIELPNV